MGTQYCYIYVAMEGCSFCPACKRTFGLIMKFPFQLSINAFVGRILKLLQSFGLPIASSWIAYEVLVMQKMPNPIYATSVVFVIAFVIARGFAVIFEVTIDSLFVCAFRDKDEFGGVFASDRLKTALGMDKCEPKKADDLAK